MSAAERLPHLFTEEDAAAYLGKSVITLRRWRKQGLLGSVKLGQDCRFTAEHLLACIETHTKLSRTPKETCLYRHFDRSGTLLYVGISVTLAQRVSAHKVNSKWFRSVATITVEWFDDVQSALEAEIKAIVEERPKHNIRGACRER